MLREIRCIDSRGIQVVGFDFNALMAAYPGSEKDIIEKARALFLRNSNRMQLPACL